MRSLQAVAVEPRLKRDEEFDAVVLCLLLHGEDYQGVAKNF
jgi:hypothetical protein